MNFHFNQVFQSVFWRRYGVIIALGGLVLVGGFLRLYEFNHWLHFELDQARDARVITRAYEGNVFDLPLLGPRAAGSFLRLAPGFYYLQYLSGTLFGHTPSGMALFVALFSTASIVVTYLLSRRAFSVSTSLGVTLLFTLSVFTVLYGRFSWNPNLLIFFIPLGLYALLRAADRELPSVQRTRWFWLAAGSLCFATHFHFVAFLTLPIIVGLFLVLRLVRIPWRGWLGAGVIVLVLYLPMVLNEVKAGFTNTQEFFQVVNKKSGDEENTHTLAEKAARDFSEYGLANVVVLSGYEGATFPRLTIEWGHFGSLCRDDCDEGKWYGLAGILALLVGVLSLFWNFWKSERSPEKDFYALVAIWFLISYVVFLPFSYDMAPRFYLLVTPLFFLILGSLRQTAKYFIRGGWSCAFFWIVIAFLAVSNGYFLFNRFDQLNRAAFENVESRPDRILKEKIRVTLEQQQAVVNFFKQRQQETGFTIYTEGDPQYRRSLEYLMNQEGIREAALGINTIYREGEYFLVFRQRESYERALRKYQEHYNVGELIPMGTLVIIPLSPKDEFITAQREDFTLPEPVSHSPAPPRYTWREFFVGQAGQVDDENPTEDIEAQEGEE